LQEEDACTVYVENLPCTATVDSVTRVFQKFGNVLYVSLPKYKTTQVHEKILASFPRVSLL
jgi:La-related protein 7